MKAIDFPQRNLLLAENQPQYDTIPVHVVKKSMPFSDGEHRFMQEVPWSMTCCYQFTDEEIAEIMANKKIFYRQMLFGGQFQPIFLSTKDPFMPENKEHWPAVE